MEEGTEYSGRRCMEAPCKINLHLSVGGRRPDGFHDLESLFVTLDYGDTLELELTGTGGTAEFSLLWDGTGPAPPELASLPPEKNLVYRALSLFREKTGFTRGLRGRIIKRIPPGSGYGGGSSDAAAALLGLDSLSGGALGPGALGELAAALGSDVPFFLRGGAALVRGRGERIEALPAPRGLTAVLVKPPFSSGTGAAFARLDRRRGEGGRDARAPEGELPAAPPWFDAGVLGKILAGPPAAWPFYNDFLPLFLETPGEEGHYREILRALRELGADFAGLSGSGSGCFGIFTGEERAKEAERALGRSWTFVKTASFRRAGEISGG